MHYKPAHLTVINRDRWLSQWLYKSCWWKGRKKKRSKNQWRINCADKNCNIYINVNYLHQINIGSTLQNVICNSEKQDSPFLLGSKKTVCLGLKRKYRKYLKTRKHCFLGLFAQISILLFPALYLLTGSRLKELTALREQESSLIKK